MFIKFIKAGTKINVQRVDDPNKLGVLTVVGGRFHVGDVIDIFDIGIAKKNNREILAVYTRPGSRSGRLEVVNGTFNKDEEWVITT